MCVCIYIEIDDIDYVCLCEEMAAWGCPNFHVDPRPWRQLAEEMVQRRQQQANSTLHPKVRFYRYSTQKTKIISMIFHVALYSFNVFPTICQMIL